MSIIIAGVEFYRCGADDEWISSDLRLRLRLDMSTPEHPWRTCLDGYWFKSHWSTPKTAIARTVHRMRRPQQPTGV